MMRRAFLVLALVLAACAAPQARRDAPLRLRAQAAAAEAGLLHYAGDGPHVLLVGAPGLSPALFDVPGFGGLAPYLQRQGYDVWVVDWRDAPLTAGLPNLGRLAHGMAAHVNADGRGLYVVAHSLGGVAWLAAAGAPQAARVVFLAVPATLHMPIDPVAEFGLSSFAAPRSLADAALAYAGVRNDRRLLDELLWSYGAEPLDPARYGVYYRPLGPALLAELAGAVKARAWPAQVKTSLGEIKAPLRVFVGQTDSLAPTWQTYETYRLAGSADKRYRFVGRANRDSREYGHLSLVAGRGAVRDVFPLVAEALAD